METSNTETPKQHRTSEIEGALSRGAKFIKTIQRPDGSWYPSRIRPRHESVPGPNAYPTRICTRPESRVIRILAPGPNLYPARILVIRIPEPGSIRVAMNEGVGEEGG